jgi:tRNA nucleotidyltransferase/poly(A) polymerase
MPSSSNYKRNYKEEYKNYHSKRKQKKNRAGRNAARSKAMKSGQVKKGDGKDIHHRDGNPQNNAAGNTVVRSASSNRSFKRNKNARKA